MTLEKLFLTCSDMNFESGFFITRVGTEMLETFKNWYEIPEEIKKSEVSCFSFYKDAEWCIVIR